MVWWSQLDKPLPKQVNFKWKGKPRRPSEEVKSQLEYDCLNHLDTPLNAVRFTSIMASVGATEDPNSIVDMVLAGMNIARVSLASASRANHQHAIRSVRDAEQVCSAKVGCCWPVALAVELKGQSISTGLLDAALNVVSIPLEIGDTILITSDRQFSNKCRSDLLYIDCPHLSSSLKPGVKILIDRGDIVLSCVKESPPYYLCRVDKKGNLGSLREVFIPGIKLNLCNLTSKDAVDIAFAIENEADILIVPHVRNADTPKTVKKKIKENEKHALVMSKICNKEGLVNIDSIIKASDGIILSQDNLSLELPTQDLWRAVNCTIAKCCREGMPVFVATSKFGGSVPLAAAALAAAADVTRAVLSGAAVALAGGELGGAGPGAEGVALAAEVCRQAEPLGWLDAHFWALLDTKPMWENANSCGCYGAALAARACGAACIVVASGSTRPARWLARLRPACPVLVVLGNRSAARRLHLYRAVLPLVYTAPPQDEWRAESERRVRFALAWGVARGVLRPGAPLVVVTEHTLSSAPGDLVRVVFVPRAAGVDGIEAAVEATTAAIEAASAVIEAAPVAVVTAAAAIEAPLSPS